MKATWRSVNSGRRLPTLGALGIQPSRAAEFKIAFFPPLFAVPGFRLTPAGFSVTQCWA